MKPTTVLRTGAGSLPTPPVIEGLRRLGCRVIAADAEPLSVGFASADASVVIPRADDSAFRSEILKICAQEGVDIVLPAVNEEILALCSFRGELQDLGVYLVAPATGVARSCLDKWQADECLRNAGLETPQTQLLASPDATDSDAAWEYPVIVKPRQGRGSRGVVVVRDAAELAQVRARASEECIVQARMTGQEYTADLLANSRGGLRMAGVRQRLRVSAGISVAGELVNSDPFFSALDQLTRRLELVGPSCVQFFWEPGRQPCFTDLNPRLGGGIALTLAGGTPLLHGILALAAGSPIPKVLNQGVGMKFLRRYDEVYLAPGDTL